MDQVGPDQGVLDQRFVDQMITDVTPPATVCGNGVVESGEACDDENTVTEACAYGEEACQVCDANCELVDGETGFCGDNITNVDEEAS